MAEEDFTLDEVIIDIVRSNKCLYDKTDLNYKDGDKKKAVWQMISCKLKDDYNIDMTAEGIEKRWTTLRDMFSREERKQKRSTSIDSPLSKSKEWYLYRSLLFLSQHIAHRRTRKSLVKNLKKNVNSSLVQSKQNRTIFDPSQFEIVLENDISQEDICNSSLIDHTYGGPQIIYTPCDKSETRPLSSCSTSSSFSSIPTELRPLISRIKPKQRRILPATDDFTKQKTKPRENLKRELVHLKRDFVQADISNSVNTMSIEIPNLVPNIVRGDDEKDGYMLAIEEGLKYVPGKNRTQCIIEVLQIIQKYEFRDEDD